jgi:hypothetical protein
VILRLRIARPLIPEILSALLAMSRMTFGLIGLCFLLMVLSRVFMLALRW